MTLPPRTITVAPGDGIGPEITPAVLDVLRAAGTPLRFEPLELGEAVDNRGISSGIPPEACDVIRRNKVLLKGPITTPQGVDVFLHWDESERNPDVLGRKSEALGGDGLNRKMITDRGVKVYPEGLPETFRTDPWCCRFTAGSAPVDFAPWSPCWAGFARPVAMSSRPKTCTRSTANRATAWGRANNPPRSEPCDS